MAKRRRVIYCQECNQPWGIVVGRDGTMEEASTAMRAAFSEQWSERWFGEGGTTSNMPPLPPLPMLEFTEIVWVTEANARFLDRFRCDMVLADCWQEPKETDIPEWWWKPRAKVALRWNCCELPHPDTDSLYQEVS